MLPRKKTRALPQDLSNPPITPDIIKITINPWTILMPKLKKASRSYHESNVKQFLLIDVFNGHFYDRQKMNCR